MFFCSRDKPRSGKFMRVIIVTRAEDNSKSIVSYLTRVLSSRKWRRR